MTRPVVLIVDPDSTRHQVLSNGLAADGYEVVLTSDPDAGRRFAAGIGPAVIVTPASLAAIGPWLSELEARGRNGLETVVLLADETVDESTVSEQVVLLRLGGLTPGEMARKLRLVLLGREIGVEVDTRLEALVGDLTELPLLQLLQGLSQALVSGRLELDRGTVFLERGQVIAAEAGPAQGLKAFCRLGRLTEGPFRVVVGTSGAEPELDLDLSSLLVAAIEDSLGEIPDLRSRIRVQMGSNAFFSTAFSTLQQQILRIAHDGTTLEEILDRLPATDGDLLQEIFHLEEVGVLSRREPRARVLVVSDSTSDLPLELARSHGIQLVPLTVKFGERSYLDRIDLAPGEFYRLLESEREHPVSEPPGPERFGRIYRPHLEERDVVSIHISSVLSDTLEHARRAAAEVLATAGERPGGEAPRIETADSRQVSAPLGLLALFAGRMAARGESAEAIIERLHAIRDRLHTFFVVDTLDYLARGGRIGRARALLGSLLGIKPILGLVDGEVAPVDRVRGGRAAHPKIIELMRQRLDESRPAIVTVAHARAPVWADRLRRLVEESFAVAELNVVEMGPVVGTHAGPGCVGLTFFQPTAEEADLVAPLAGPGDGEEADGTATDS